MVNETVKGNKRLCVTYVVWIHEWKCMSVYIILLLIKDVLPAFEKVHRTHFYCYSVKTDYNIVIDIKFQFSLSRKNILIFINLFY